MSRVSLFSRRTRSSKPAQVTKRRLMCEPLEGRQMMAAGITQTLTVESVQGNISANSTITDAEGNTYIAGSFSTKDATGTIDFQPNRSYPDNRDLVPDQIGSRGFIVKYDANQDVVWIRRKTGAVTNLVMGSGGTLYCSISVGGGQMLEKTSDLATGAPQWQHQFSTYMGPAFALDATEGRVYFAGTQRVGNYDGTRVSALTLGANGVTGTAWTAVASGTTNGGAAAPSNILVTGSGATASVYVTGQFTFTCDFDPSSKSLNLSVGGSGRNDGYKPRAGYVWKLNGNGALAWAGALQVANNPDSSSINHVAVDASGNVILGGNFNGTVDFDPGKGKSQITGSGGFVMKLTAAGAFVPGSVQQLGVLLHDMEVDSAGSIYVAAGAEVKKFSNSGVLLWTVNTGRNGGNLALGISGKVHYVGSVQLWNDFGVPGYFFWDELSEI